MAARYRLPRITTEPVGVRYHFRDHIKKGKNAAEGEAKVATGAFQDKDYASLSSAVLARGGGEPSGENGWRFLTRAQPARSRAIARRISPHRHLLGCQSGRERLSGNAGSNSMQHSGRAKERDRTGRPIRGRLNPSVRVHLTGRHGCTEGQSPRAHRSG